MNEIDRLYHELGGPNSYLGSPTDDERDTAAGFGRIRSFRGGTILWLPETGPMAHSGNIDWQPLPDKFTVFQQNMALLPPLQLPNGENLYRGHEREAAMERLISYLTNTKPNVVGLSEMWVSEERRDLLEYFEDLYPFRLEGPGQSVDQSLDGGLLMLSQSPFQDYSASTYPQCLGEDCFSQKGILHGKVSLPIQGTSIGLFLTHLQNPTPFLQSPNRGFGANGTEKVQAQLDHLAAFVHNNRYPLAPALILGDLNVDGFNKEGYEDLLSRLDKPVDLLASGGSDEWEDKSAGSARIADQPAITFDARNTFSATDENLAQWQDDDPSLARFLQGKRLDYFLSFPGERTLPVYGPASIIRLESNSGRDISDHFGVFVELIGLIQFQ